MSSGKLILDQTQIAKKLKRIAFEIVEDNFDEHELLIIGIWERGYIFALELIKHISTISSITTSLIRLDIDKLIPSGSNLELSKPLDDLSNSSVLLVDDVLNTGKTLAYGMIPILDAKPRKLETAVLVNRSHKLFPISATFTGLELATTLDEHIEVVFNEDAAVYLK